VEEKMDGKEFMALMSLDWADRRHVGCLQVAGSEEIEVFELEQKAIAIAEWVSKLRVRFKGGRIAIAVEQRRGPLVYALMKYEVFVIFPLNTTAVKNYRKALRASGAKDDFSDARLQLLFLEKHIHQLRRLEPDSLLTRQLRLLVEARRNLVDRCSALGNQLTALLKEYFPTSLELVGDLKTSLACDFLTKYPSLKAAKALKSEQLRAFYQKRNCRSRKAIENRLMILQQAAPLIEEKPVLEIYELMMSSLVAQMRLLLTAISNFDQKIEILFQGHPDFEIYKSFPSAGPALAPRLAVVFGEDRARYDNAGAISTFSGIAPVRIQSGQKKTVCFRWSAPKFVRQSLVEYSRLSIKKSQWAKAFYWHLRSRGKGHHAAIRALAFKWIRILYRCWKDRIAYDESIYLDALKRRNSPLIQLLT
jgi:hypothetical protein